MITEKEFNNIYTSHAHKVFRLCLGYATGNEDLAKEWQQETFIKVWKHRGTFKKESSISTWIYRIAINTCLGDLRKSKKHVQINETILSAAETPNEDIKKDKQLTKMYDCINQLTQNNRAIVLLELEEIPQATIAETMGLAHGALRTRLSRIRQALLKCITNGK